MDIDVALSASSLASLAERVERMSEALDDACGQACRDIADYAVPVARSGAPADTGQLQGSIAVEETADGCDVVCSAPYAAFVEFGTGLGSPASSAKTLEAMDNVCWGIDQKGRGLEGWPFPRDDGSFGWTHGQSGKGFMGRAAEEARAVAPDIVAERVREALRG